MRNAFRLAGFAAALLVGAATIVASEESVRLARVVERPEDLATLFADAQTAVTYDSVSGRFYYPSLGLYFDTATSMFYDPSTGAYRDYALRGEYSYCGMDDMYYDAVSGLYFDAAKRMSFNPNTGLYLLDGAYYVWDSQFNMLRDPESGDYYDRGLEARVSYNASLDMFYDYNERKYYDPNLGLYYDEGMELFFDPICGRYYDRDAQMYYDPKTGNASLDADGTFYYDDMAGAYYNEKDGCWYEYDMSLDLYADRNSYGMGMMMGMGYGPRYYDPETEFHFNYDGSNYVVEETYDLYDPYSQCYFDLYNWTSYCYDPETGGFVYAMSDMSYTPYWMESGSYAWRADDDSTQNNVDLSNMYYDSMMGMYYDSYSMLYYDADDGMYYDGMSYYREPWGDSYWYDSMSQCYVSYRTGEHYTPSRSISPNGVDLSRMEYDSMRDLYYDSSTYLYYDAKIGLYTDFMNYYREPGGYGYYYDSMQNAYVCYSTGEVYHPHGQMGSIGQMYDQLTEGQLLEIQATFLALDYLSSLPAEIETMTEKRIEMGTYTAAPYGLEDALWFEELMEQGMSCQERRIRLCRGVMPNTLEVSWAYSDPWSMPGSECFNSAGMVVPVSETLWNRAERHVVFILNAGWMSCSMNALNIVHGDYGTGYYDDMYWYVSFGMGENCLSESDQAVYNRFSNDLVMLNHLANISYYGSWSVSTMYGDVDMVSGGNTSVGGIQDHDGDGLSDLDEIKYGTNPFMPDTDGDGLSDALEIRIGSCPTMYDEDSDYDGMADVWETYFGLNPENAVDANADPDHDGLNNLRECQLGTNPRSVDTDGDGLRDGDELEHGTQPCNPDTDNDQLPDGAEVARGTNPCNPDTDLDGLLDGREVGLGLDPLSVDTDCDGIADSDEVEYQLLGLSAEAKATNEIAYRLRNWLPTDIEDLYSDFDADGTPDWVEYLGGFRPGNGSDVFLGTDGFPAVFVMTVNVEVEGLARPVMLDCNGEKVCVNRSCSIKRYGTRAAGDANEEDAAGDC